MIAPEHPSQRWLAAPAQDCVWAEYDDDFVLFHRRSGHTHFVNASTAILLTEVLRSPRTSEEAAEELAAAQRANATADFVPQVLGLMLRLEELGLVERVAA